jgi:hypothetical protein
MFYEKLDFIKFDLEKLREDVKNHVFTLGNQVIQGEEFETPQYHGFGGWSLLSRTGEWQDGFEFFQTGENEQFQGDFFPKGQNNFAVLKYLNVAHSMEYKNPTEAYVGEIKNVISQIDELGFYPRRARVTCLKAGCKSLVHSDGPMNEYIARIHIPLFTNDKCVFVCDGVDLYMEAGSVYMVWVNTWHQIRNDSNEDRYHIILDAYDTKHITKNFKYEGDINQLIEHAEKYRENIDAAVVTEEDIIKFEQIKQKYITKK